MVEVKQNIFRTLIVAFALAVFLTLVLQPTAHFDPFVSFLVIIVMEVIGISVSLDGRRVRWYGH